MPRTLKNNDSLLIFFVGREAFSPVWSEGQVVQMGPGDQASQGGPGGQVVRWSLEREKGYPPRRLFHRSVLKEGSKKEYFSSIAQKRGSGVGPKCGRRK